MTRLKCRKLSYMIIGSINIIMIRVETNIVVVTDFWGDRVFDLIGDEESLMVVGPIKL